MSTRPHRWPHTRLTAGYCLGAFILILSSISAHGELRSFNQLNPPSKDPEQMVKRVEVLNGRSFPEPLKEKMRPNHVYQVFHPKLKHWIFRITDAKGRLPEPAEALSPDSVVEGAAVGGETNKNYLLTSKSEWVVTRKPVRKVMWVLDTIPDPRVYVPLQENRARRMPAKNGSSRSPR